jgi:hypothetical protein
VLWKALPKRNPTKLDSTQNSLPTANGDFPNINYPQCHINYFSKNIGPKIVKPGGHARYHTRVPLKLDAP